MVDQVGTQVVSLRESLHDCQQANLLDVLLCQPATLLDVHLSCPLANLLGILPLDHLVILLRSLQDSLRDVQAADQADQQVVQLIDLLVNLLKNHIARQPLVQREFL